MKRNRNSRRPFQTVGIRMRNFGRMIMRNYAATMPEFADLDEAETAVWQQDEADFGGYGAPYVLPYAAPVATDSEADDAAYPPDSDVSAAIRAAEAPVSRRPAPSHRVPPQTSIPAPAVPVQRAPSAPKPVQRQPASPASSPSDTSNRPAAAVPSGSNADPAVPTGVTPQATTFSSPLQKRLAAILNSHNQLEAERSQIREEKKARYNEAVQRQANSTSPETPAQIRRPRRGSAAVQYLETSALVPPGEQHLIVRKSDAPDPAASPVSDSQAQSITDVLSSASPSFAGRGSDDVEVGDFTEQGETPASSPMSQGALYTVDTVDREVNILPDLATASDVDIMGYVQRSIDRSLGGAVGSPTVGETLTNMPYPADMPALTEPEDMSDISADMLETRELMEADQPFRSTDSAAAIQRAENPTTNIPPVIQHTPVASPAAPNPSMRASQSVGQTGNASVNPTMPNRVETTYPVSARTSTVDDSDYSTPPQSEADIPFELETLPEDAQSSLQAFEITRPSSPVTPVDITSSSGDTDTAPRIIRRSIGGGRRGIDRTITPRSEQQDELMPQGADLYSALVSAGMVAESTALNTLARDMPPHQMQPSTLQRTTDQPTTNIQRDPHAPADSPPVDSTEIPSGIAAPDSPLPTHDVDLFTALTNAGVVTSSPSTGEVRPTAAQEQTPAIQRSAEPFARSPKSPSPTSPQTNNSALQGEMGSQGENGIVVNVGSDSSRADWATTLASDPVLREDLLSYLDAPAVPSQTSSNRAIQRNPQASPSSHPQEQHDYSQVEGHASSTENANANGSRAPVSYTGTEANIHTLQRVIAIGEINTTVDGNSQGSQPNANGENAGIGSEPGKEINVDQLARDVYQRLRERLRIERERRN